MPAAAARSDLQVGHQAELAVQLRSLLAEGQGLCRGFSPSLLSRCIFKAEAGVAGLVRSRGGCAGWAQSPGWARPDPANPGAGGSSRDWLCSDTEGQPNLQSQGRAAGSSCTSHQVQEMLWQCPPAQQRGEEGLGSARAALGCSQLLFQGQDGGTGSGLPNPAVLAQPSSRSRGRIQNLPRGARGAQKMTLSSCVLSHHRLLFRVPKLLSSSSCSLASSTNTCSSVA